MVVTLEVVEAIVLRPLVRHVIIDRGDDAMSSLAEDGRLVALGIRLASFVRLVDCHAFTSVLLVNGRAATNDLHHVCCVV